jgi:MFS transporter, OCT family, solute carrier family 22 (organic cation transporter), member 4/5
MINDISKKTENILSIFKSSRIFLLSIILFFNWAINNFMFYGLSLKSNDLGVSPYLSFTISACVEILVYAVVHLILDRTGRKLPYFVFLFLTGISCLSIVFTGKHETKQKTINYHNIANYVIIYILENLILTISVAMVGKFCASGAYAIIILYTSELLPTSIRNSGMVSIH